MTTDKVLDVPHVSQYVQLSETHMAIRACGITCVYMVLSFFKIQSPPLAQMFTQGKDTPGAYVEAGWVHQYFVDLFHRLGFASARREENMHKSRQPRNADNSLAVANVFAIAASIDQGSPVIASLVYNTLTKEKYHMVLVVGYKKDKVGHLLGFFVHDPEATKEMKEPQFVALSTFETYWRQMAIFPGLPSQPCASPQNVVD